MSDFVDWREVKEELRATDPDRDSPARVERRRAMRAETLAAVSGARLADVRRQLGLTQVQLAGATGLSQARISQIENGRSVSLEVLRTYVGGLGGQVDIVARIGDIQLNVA
jgi:DNA-binding XRE family transcriptional regulator